MANVFIVGVVIKPSAGRFLTLVVKSRNIGYMLIGALVFPSVALILSVILGWLFF